MLSAPTRRARAALTAAALAAAAASARPLFSAVAGETAPASAHVARGGTKEIELGRRSAQEVAQTVGLVDDDTLQQYVQSVGARLAAGSERPNLPWTFRVVDDPVPNSFAFPGGFVLITRGLVELLNSEAELAAVLGHQIGHVNAGHPAQQVSRGQLAPLGLGLGAALVPQLARYGDLASPGLGLMYRKYSRDEERQADELSFEYMLRQKYDVREMAGVYVVLRVGTRAVGQSPLPTWRSTHPYVSDRLERTRTRLAALKSPLTGALSVDDLVSNRVDYLRQVKGLAYGVNPRRGFFQGSGFIHPDLHFRLDVPRGWQKRNLGSTVVAVSPGQDAIIQLTLAPETDPASAARSFLTQRGVEAGRAFTDSINGEPVAGRYFQTRTAQGPVQGVVVYVAYEGRTYQLLAYAPAGRLAQYDKEFRRTAISFSPLVDRQLLSVQPHRIEIEIVEQTVSLVQFNTLSPSASPLDDVVRLNQLPSPDAQIPAGELVKRVIEGWVGE